MTLVTGVAAYGLDRLNPTLVDVRLAEIGAFALLCPGWHQSALTRAFLPFVDLAPDGLFLIAKTSS